MGSLIKFLQLPFSKQHLFGEAVLILTATRIILKLLPYKVLRRVLFQPDRFDVFRHQKGTQDDFIWAINKAGKYTLRENSCLALASAGNALLRLHGFPARMRLGFQKSENGEIEAHAWVEINGEVVIGGTDRDIEHYIPLLESKEQEHE